MELIVECYSGHTYAQEPRAFVWHGERHVVQAVERTWRAPEGPHFLARTKEGGFFELAYDEAEDVWSVRARVTTAMSGADTSTGLQRAPRPELGTKAQSSRSVQATQIKNHSKEDQR